VVQGLLEGRHKVVQVYRVQWQGAGREGAAGAGKERVGGQQRLGGQRRVG
jgi:hypothetical protein